MTLGANNGWDDAEDNNDGQSVEGELSLNPTSNISLVLNGIYGSEQVNARNTQRWAIDPIATWHTPITGLQVIGEYLYADEGSPIAVAPAYSSHGNRFCIPGVAFCAPAPGYPAGPNGTVNYLQSASWTGAAGYIVYDLNDHIEFASRGEWFRDSQGVRTGLRRRSANSPRISITRFLTLPGCSRGSSTGMTNQTRRRSSGAPLLR